MNAETYLVDAFADRPFAGNPAAVCVLESWPSDAILQDVTNEFNQSETAFLVPTPDAETDFELRWFTVSHGEIDLCGHATLASAHVVFRHLGFPRNEVRFATRHVGILKARRDDSSWITLDLPAWPPSRVPGIPAGAAEALGGVTPREVYRREDFLVLLADEDEVRAVQPDFVRLARVFPAPVCITALGREREVVSRYFCPGEPHPEDPVTGRAHSMLVPFWAERLGTTTFPARQLSRRGGELRCALIGDRVALGAQAHTVLRGGMDFSDGAPEASRRVG